MRFDWLKFVTRNRVPHVTHGPNVARNHIGIKCPWCGQADKSEHMGLCLTPSNPAWGCFRNSQHRGRNPARLIVKLLGCSMENARRMVDAELANVEDFEATVAMLRAPEPPEALAMAGPVGLPIPAEFRRLGNQPENRYESRFLAYLAGRGFGDDAALVALAYSLFYAVTGKQAWRVIFPVPGPDGALLGWTGRAITEAELRYKASDNLGKDVLLTFPYHMDAPDTLVIVEGPMDALKLDAYGGGMGIKAVATMGTAFTSAQLAALYREAKGMRRVWAIFDEDALSKNMRLTDEVPGAQWFRLPADVEDPGALTAQQALALCEQLVA